MHGMVRLAPGVEVPAAALTFTQIAGGGPGGQHANKTATRVELRLRLDALPIHPEAAARLVSLAGERLTGDGELVLVCDETRSARQNRSMVIERLCELVVAALVRPKPRRRTKPSRGSKERRLEAKRQRSGRLSDRGIND
ncbi:MAG: alternative ribosome rescue aminoacyl-tRNA hydrolase ArfB [Planctomycetota bacterium]